MIVDKSYIKWVTDAVKVQSLDLNNLTKAQKEWIENSEKIAEYLQAKIKYIETY